MNDKDLGTLLLNWQILMDIGHDASVEERENIMNQLYSNKELINEINNTEDSFVLLDVMFISKYEMAVNSVEEKQLERYNNAQEEYYYFVDEYPQSKYIPEMDRKYEEISRFLKNYNFEE